MYYLVTLSVYFQC